VAVASDSMSEVTDGENYSFHKGYIYRADRRLGMILLSTA